MFRDSAGLWQVEQLAPAGSRPAVGVDALGADTTGVSGRLSLPDPPDVHLSIGGWDLVFSAGGDDFVWFYRADPELDVQIVPPSDVAGFQSGT